MIVGGDSDFLSLVEKLKQYNKKVFVIGGRQFTSIILQKNCHEFIAYENLVRKPAPARGGRPASPQASAQVSGAFPISSAFPLVRRAIKILADREVSPQTGLLKSTLLQLDSTFSERNYGASSFLDFAEKLAQSGLVQLKHAGRSVMVELNPGFAEDADAKARPIVEGTETPIDEGMPTSMAEPTFGAPTETFARPAAEEALPRLGDNAEGVKMAGQLLAAATGARWPMYLRNVKQILRAASFDERRYGFGGLMELLKACQREGLLRVERDRRGGLRVFQGQGIARPSDRPSDRPSGRDDDGGQANGNVAAPQAAQSFDDDAQPIEVVNLVVIDEVDGEIIEAPPISVIDTTAELLGRAKPKKPRTRAGGAIHHEAPAPARSAPSRPGRSTGGQRKPAAGARKAAPAPRGRGRVKKDGEVDGNR